MVGRAEEETAEGRRESGGGGYEVQRSGAGAAASPRGSNISYLQKHLHPLLIYVQTLFDHFYLLYENEHNAYIWMPLLRNAFLSISKVLCPLLGATKVDF